MSVRTTGRLISHDGGVSAFSDGESTSTPQARITSSWQTASSPVWDLLDGDDDDFDPLEWARSHRRTGSTDPADSVVEPLQIPGSPETSAPELSERELAVIADEFPLRHPPSYRRDLRGVWRYDWGPRVPGARDATPARLIRPVRVDGLVYLPRLLVHAWFEPFLQACSVDATRPRWAVCTERAFDTVANRPVGIDAAELAPWALVDAQQAADTFRIRRTTLASYLARGLLPEPQARLGRTPLWSWPVLLRWRAQIRRRL